MNHLVVYAHPNPASFNHAILDAYTSELKASGHEVRIRDLYAVPFDPVIVQSDYDMINRGTPPEDIRREHDLIRWAGTMTFIFPIFWAGMPAMLKGYIEKVFSLGFAYIFEGDRPKGILKGKKAVIINTTGGALNYYQKSGMIENIRQTIDGGIFRFCGFQVLEHRFFVGVPISTPAERSLMLEEVRGIARSLSS
ncbi:MAG TPA: NAD(P)H-dependent oxidoreductase [Desulfomonilia bacterium]|jgi:NAD(P)H dehydrogenase (quinone)|nr:NAD(P)H-dependent oxidoreductase [Desulfomonilia bacterium]